MGNDARRYTRIGFADETWQVLEMALKTTDVPRQRYIEEALWSHLHFQLIADKAGISMPSQAKRGRPEGASTAIESEVDSGESDL